ncbi:glycine--tRNA ligase [Blattabacterium cuenoti]|uniref:glycine--tRNA ligase n=1 Tax=Blattabacterium cuenoti TaxID=1653831 RepID=UPI00163BCCB1|nr:glycine--tRNA ligase [Blattabacterium cuenoti]
MKKDKEFINFLISHSKTYGFVFPSSEIYGGINAIYDYGQNGIELKNNIKEFWWKSMTQVHDNIVGIDSSILTHSKIWEASGHISKFNDLFIDNKDSNKRYRPDLLIKEYVYKNFSNKINKKKEILSRLSRYIENKSMVEIKDLIFELNIRDPICNTNNWTDIRDFNMMFRIKEENNENKFFLRPETAQGIFCNFNNVKKSNRMKIPFGIAQIGKVFRNEIIARRFLFRLREFEQMEMQFFINPKDEIYWYEYWKNIRIKWHKIFNLGEKKYRLFDQKNPPHYASKGVDIEFNFPFGFKELESIHSRTDYDLKKHEFFSKKKFKVFDNLGINYVPYVIETSLGLDRCFLAILSSSLKKEKLENGNTRILLKIPSYLSPVKAAIFPLVSKDGLPELAKNLFNKIKFNYKLVYDYKESIGKLYRRQDAIGTPLCFTVDYETMRTGNVTVRYRDSMKQKRIHINKISSIIKKETALENVLKKVIT